jgi:tetratricopeptide (TPR) repeat protein/predicted Ser/Thr protein kinase
VETIGKYQIQKVLGRGGMGTVYEAVDPHINRKVAVKTMIQGLAESPDLRARFLREAQAAGGLRHRNIVTVYDLGEDKGQPYIAMEFIEGTDLEKIIQNREPHSLEWKLDVLRQICAGLGYAHRSGVVHRDIKPANIRVTSEGEVKIMDFGIAHLQSSTMTKSGLVLGTVHYMAPEQVEGHKVDHRADIFAVGAIAYELIAHRKPFEGESLTAVMFKITRERPDPAPLSNTPFSPGIEASVMKALARDPAARYQSLDEMHADLDRLLREGPVRGMPPVVAAPLGGTPDTAREKADLRAAMEQALQEGQLQKALGLCRRLAEIAPGDAEITTTAAQIEMAIRDREVENLCGLALAYAADGDTELAQKIAGRIEHLAPTNKRFLQLRKYLDEELARRRAETLTSSAREHLVEGNLAEARALADEALVLYPDHAVAREIRDRTTSVLAAQERRGPKPAPAAESVVPPAVELEAPPPPPAVVPPAVAPVAAAPPAVAVVAPAPIPVESRVETPSPTPQVEPEPVPQAPVDVQKPVATPPPPAGQAAPTPLTPLPEGDPLSPGAAALVETARRFLRDRSPQKALAPLEQAAVIEPGHAGIQRLLSQTRIEARKTEIESLTTAALNAFVANNYAKAKKAVEKALVLDPKNKKAQELLKILGALG